MLVCFGMVAPCAGPPVLSLWMFYFYMAAIVQPRWISRHRWSWPSANQTGVEGGVHKLASQWARLMNSPIILAWHFQIQENLKQLPIRAKLRLNKTSFNWKQFYCRSPDWIIYWPATQGCRKTFIEKRCKPEDGCEEMSMVWYGVAMLYCCILIRLAL